MLVKIAPAGPQKEHPYVVDELVLPEWFMDDRARRAKALVDRMARQEWERDNPDYVERTDRSLRDTKPDFYVNRDNPNRVVIAVGAGEVFREDLKDLTMRVKEKPDPAKDPKWRKQHDVINDLDRLAEMQKDQKAGRMSPSRPTGSLRFQMKWEGSKA